jgi:hypothetical protein
VLQPGFHLCRDRLTILPSPLRGCFSSDLYGDVVQPVTFDRPPSSLNAEPLFGGPWLIGRIVTSLHVLFIRLRNRM